MSSGKRRSPESKKRSGLKALRHLEVLLAALDVFDRHGPRNAIGRPHRGRHEEPGRKERHAHHLGVPEDREAIRAMPLPDLVRDQETSQTMIGRASKTRPSGPRDPGNRDADEHEDRGRERAKKRLLVTPP